MSSNVPISKENLDTYLSELGKRFRKLNGTKIPAEIILIGGASVLVNYGFRDVTYDADALIFASSVMKEAIGYIRDEFGLPHEWLNEGFKRTESYSNRLMEVSIYYRTFSNIMTVRTVSAEYLVAMKAMSGRQYKYDLSDIVGILLEHRKKGNPISRDTVDNAIIKLYYDKPLPEISLQVLNEAYEREDLETYYVEVRENEKDAKSILLDFEKENPGELRGENINSIIKQVRQNRSEKLMDKEQSSQVNEAQPDYNRLYTVEDYHSWDESFRAELYEGTLIVSESPTRKHQGILIEIAAQLHNFLKGKLCKVYPAPFSVRLSKEEESIFEPDIVVVCDESKLTERGCVGAPDLVIEILSPSTARMDKKLKYQKYQQAGVREYWIIDPELDLLEVNVLRDKKYTTTIYNEEDKVTVTVLEDCVINLADVFSEV